MLFHISLDAVVYSLRFLHSHNNFSDIFSFEGWYSYRRRKNIIEGRQSVLVTLLKIGTIFRIKLTHVIPFTQNQAFKIHCQYILDFLVTKVNFDENLCTVWSG